MLTLRRFRTMADSYGADLLRWPDGARAEAQALLKASPAARALLDEARTLDDAIEAAGASEDAVLWEPDGQDAALARLRSGVEARIVASAERRPTFRRTGWALGAAHSLGRDGDRWRVRDRGRTVDRRYVHVGPRNGQRADDAAAGADPCLGRLT